MLIKNIAMMWRKRRKLRPILRKAKQIPEYKNKSKLEGGVLVIKGRKYTTKNLHTLPDDLSGFKASSKQEDRCIGFFGELSPFSNFHTAYMEIDGIKFHSSEQWIQYQKAKFFNDTSTSNKILQADSALECKNLSKEITNYEPTEWCERAGQLCECGLEAKFHQNPMLLKLLQSTGEKTLVECAYDRLWGNGIPLHAENWLIESDWPGDNLLGKILM